MTGRICPTIATVTTALKPPAVSTAREFCREYRTVKLLVRGTPEDTGKTKTIEALKGAGYKEKQVRASSTFGLADEDAVEGNEYLVEYFYPRGIKAVFYVVAPSPELADWLVKSHMSERPKPPTLIGGTVRDLAGVDSMFIGEAPYEEARICLHYCAVDGAFESGQGEAVQQAAAKRYRHASRRRIVSDLDPVLAGFFADGVNSKRKLAIHAVICDWGDAVCRECSRDTAMRGGLLQQWHEASFKAYDTNVVCMGTFKGGHELDPTGAVLVTGGDA